MVTSIRQTFDLIGRDRPSRWALLVLLAVVVSAFEMVGAVLVYALLALVVDPSGSIDLPLVGDLQARLGGVDQTSLLLSFVAAVAAFFAIRGVVKVGAIYIQARVAHNAGARLSNRLVEGYLHLPYASHLERHSSEFIRNGHQAVVEVVGQVIMPVIRIAAEAILLLGMLVVLTVIAPAATGLAILVVGGAAVALLLFVQPRLKRIGVINHEESRATLGSLQQSLHGIRDIKVLGREPFFVKEYAQSRIRMARSQYLHAAAWQLPTIVIETALLGFILLFFAVALLQGDAAQDTLSVLGLFAYVGLRLQPSLRDIVAGLNSLKFASAPLDSLHRDMRKILEVPRERGPAEPLPFRESLELTRVSFRYPGAEQDVLTNVDVLVRPGEQIGICGPTGSGKTTLVDLMTGLLHPTNGRVTVDGHDIRDQTRAWHQNLGIVPQMVFLTDDTLRRNIALGVAEGEVDEAALQEAVHLAQLDDFVAALEDGLETKIGERGVRVSGGQRQRIAIARALYVRPSVLIFDEGTSALDNTTERELMHAIERLRGRHTIILIAHRLDTVRDADRVIFLEQGRVAGVGSYSDLMLENASFRKMAGANVE